ncbi:hypothetical protein BN1708_019108, partial [Verticillium longisporum]
LRLQPHARAGEPGIRPRYGRYPSPPSCLSHRSRVAQDAADARSQQDAHQPRQ